ncbi:PACE efflux transporter [Rhizobium deserti]|uniref:PACE efflux transporter n=1 Tax=Rhizobium deserti TaxID=2547961 RepID=A0A4R5UH49_9HYPH|nr:PACE efflux transporter [Rhizobium deserti]TDK35263.1 PACE efflux transporter [Rhizobium deserti]
MRSTSDRIRHAISFEIIGLALVTPLGALAFDQPWSAIGIVGVAGATLATGWNYLYNLGFDHLMQRLTGSSRKSVAVRVAHALLFELGLLIVLMPMIAWYLEVSLIQALAMDISFAAFYVVYAFAFNWIYDRLFPLPEWQGKTLPENAQASIE